MKKPKKDWQLITPLPARVPRFVKNVVTRPYVFAVRFRDGSTEEIAVEAESASAAVLELPVGVCEWELIDSEQGE